MTRRLIRLIPVIRSRTCIGTEEASWSAAIKMNSSELERIALCLPFGFTIALIPIFRLAEQSHSVCLLLPSFVQKYTTAVSLEERYAKRKTDERFLCPSSFLSFSLKRREYLFARIANGTTQLARPWDISSECVEHLCRDTFGTVGIPNYRR